MTHQDVTAMQLVRFIRNQSNIDSLYHIVGQMSKEEFGFLMLAQQSEEDAVAFLDRNQQVLRSMAEQAPRSTLLCTGAATKNWNWISILSMRKLEKSRCPAR